MSARSMWQGNVKILFLLAIVIFLGATTIPQTRAWINPDIDPVQKKAPTAIVGDNIYVVWFTDKGTPNSNGEVMFRASQDGGETFGEKINLSNSTNADSISAEIAADASTVIVTWWEKTNQTDTPVVRISTDMGNTFGPVLELAVNGTIGTGEAKPLL